MSKKTYTFQDFNKQFPTEERCLRFIFRIKYSESFVCGNCGRQYCCYLLKKRRTYNCSVCGTHVSVTSNTIIYRSRTALVKWFYAIYLLTSAPIISAKHLQRQLHVSYKCAWRIRSKILYQFQLQSHLQYAYDYDKRFVTHSFEYLKNLEFIFGKKNESLDNY